jgi:metal-responsive CopG/Arc/MetJ family transcriptional regulator
MTPQSGPGRPSKSDGQKRQSLHVSVYTEDLERLDQLTENRSEFLRGCIERAWEEEHSEDVTISVTLPKWLIEELVKALTAQMPARERTLIETAAKGLLQKR